MADAAIVSRSLSSAPKDYTLGSTEELLLKAVRASIDGSGAAGAYLPALQLVAPDGTVMWTAVPPTSLTAGVSVDASWFPGGGLGAEILLEETVGVTQEVFYVNTPSAAPVSSVTTLTSGVSYVVVIEGTWSDWNQVLLVGSPEADAMFPGPTAGRVSTQVGLDAETLFAEPTASNPLGHWPQLQMSLDGGATFAHIEPIGGPYSTPQTGHLYRYTVTGQGHPLEVSVIDTPVADNYGKLRVTLMVPSGTGTGSGSGSLVPPADSTNNAEVLAVLGGVPTFSAVDGGSA